MDEQPPSKLEPPSATGPEALSPELAAASGPPPPLPTRRVARSNVAVEAAAGPEPLVGVIVADVEAVEASPPAILDAQAQESLPQAPAAPEAPSELAEPRRGVFVGASWNVSALGLVTFFTTAAGEMVVPLRMLFLVAVLQTPLALAGLIEGIAESASSLLRIAAGRLAHRTGSRKGFMVLGYGLSAIARPLLAFVGAWQGALGLILLDRAGRGVRSMPRDAALASSAPESERAKVFGFHRGMDTLGALVGPLLAFALLLLTYDDARAALAWTAVPGALSVLALVLFFRARRPPADTVVAATEAPSPLLPASTLGRRFWMFTAISVVFALGSASEAFIFLRAADLGDSLLMVPLAYFGSNLVYALLAAPLGVLSVRFGRLPVLLAGYSIFLLVYLGFAVSVEGWNAWALFLAYGLYAAAAEGMGRAFVGDIVPREARSTALAWFIGLVGLTAVPANVIAGWLWSTMGPSATFTFGAWAAAVAVALTLAWLPWLRSRTAPEEAFMGTQEPQALA